VAHRLIVDRDGDLHSDLHARFRSRRSGMDLAGAVGAVVLGNLVVLLPIALTRTPARATASPSPCSPAARSGSSARTSRDSAGPRGLRLVRHPDMDRRLAIYKLVEVIWPGIATLPQILPSFVGLNTGSFSAL